MKQAMQSDMSKIVLAVIVTAILVGGGVYFWQQNVQKIVPQKENVVIPTTPNQEQTSTSTTECNDKNPCSGDFACIDSKCEAVPLK